MPTLFKTFTSLEATDEFIRRMKATCAVSSVHSDVATWSDEDGQVVAEAFHETELAWVAVIKEVV